MSEQNLSAMTVIELRKLAKELRVPLSAGISKQGIIDRLSQAIAAGKAQPEAVQEELPIREAQPAAEEAPEADDKPADDSDEAPEKPAAPEAAAAPGFRQAYVSPRFNTKPAYQAPSYNRSAAPRTPAPMDSQRPQATRPTGFTPRFGPAAQEHPAPHHDEERPAPEQRPAYQAEQPAFEQRPAYQAERPAFEQRPAYQAERPAFEQRPAYQAERPAFEQRPAYQAERRPGYNDNQRFQQRQGYEQRPSYEARQSFEQPARPAYEPRPAASPAVNDMLSAGDCIDGSGVLELHPDGYGFLRSDSLLPSSKDIYVSAAQVRRFGLRTGDRVVGKNRPLRDGDKYSAMLYITEVNGAAPEGQMNRPAFEDLTPIYPTRRISLKGREGDKAEDLRLIDLLTPIGFGQRALVQCAPQSGKRRLLRNLANAIAANHPDAKVMVLLFSQTPEDVTLFRDQVTCPVLATTFDMPPENHIRLADMAAEYAQRMAEQKQDVILLVDHLTTLSKVCTTAALQQGRQTLGAVSPTSLQKAKRLFGTARCLREGGSITVIAAISTDTGSKVDEAIVSEFRGTANMELTLGDAEGAYPAVDLLRSGTRRAEGITTPAQQEGLRLIRSLLSDLSPAAARTEILSMISRTADNDELLVRIKDWTEAMKK